VTNGIKIRFITIVEFDKSVGVFLGHRHPVVFASVCSVTLWETKDSRIRYPQDSCCQRRDYRTNLI